MNKAIKSDNLSKDIAMGSLCIVMFPKEIYDRIVNIAMERDMEFSEFLSHAIDSYIKKGE